MTAEERPVADDAVRPAAGDLYRSGGHGLFVGVMAAGLSHLFQGAALPVLAFAYLFGMSRLRGWKELVALLTMMSTVVLYFVAYDVVAALSPGAWGVVAVVAGTVVLAFGAGMAVSAFVSRAMELAHAVPSRGPLGRRHPAPLPAEDVDRWEAGYFARLRADARHPRRRVLHLVWPMAVVLVMIPVPALVDSQALGALSACVGLFHVVVSGRQFAYNDRLHSSGAQDVLLWDTRPPVLLLRSFSLDALPMHVLDRKFSRKTLDFFAWMDKRSFEEVLTGEFEQVGPVVAVGRPGETVAPSGAAREYLADEVWQERVLARARSAQCVLMLVDASPGMTWEIEHVTQAVGLQRVLFVIPPYEDEYGLGEASRDVEAPAAWEQRWAALRSRFPFLPELAADVRAVLYDDAGQPVLVRSEDGVEERIQAVRAAWQRERGLPVTAATRASSAAARDVLESAALATASGLGLELPRALQRGSSRRRVARGDLTAALTEVERSLAQLSDAVGPRHPATGAARVLLGRLYLQAGDLPLAREQYAAAVEVLDAAQGTSIALAAHVHQLLANLLVTSGDLAAARQHLDAALAVADGPGGGTLTEIDLLLGVPDLDEAARSVAQAQLRAALAHACQQLGDLDAARDAYDAALPVLDAASLRSGSGVSRWWVGMTRNNYAQVLHGLGDIEAALSEGEAALASLREELQEPHLLLAIARNNIGLALKQQGERDAARAQYEEAVAMLDAVLTGPDGEAARANPGLGQVYANLGTLLHELGDDAAAREHLARGVALTEAAAGPEDARMAALRCSYGTVLHALGETAQARTEVERAVAISELTRGPEHPQTQLFRTNLRSMTP